LLICAWLNESFENIINLCNYLYILNGFTCNSTKEPTKEISKSSSNENLNKLTNLETNQDFESVFINDYFKKFKKTCETSESLAESLFLCWVIRSIIIQVNFILLKLNQLLFRKKLNNCFF
jgi:hypothetical protein